MTWPRAGLLLAWALLAAQTIPVAWREPLEIDEQVTCYLAAGRTPPTVWRRCQDLAATPPLSFWLVRASLGLPWGTDEFRLRLPAMLATGCGLWFAWRIGERRLGAGWGVAAALLLAAHPLVAKQFAGQARPYAFGFLLTLAGLDAVLRLRSSAWRWRDVALFGAVAVALPWTHYLFALTVPALLLAAWAARDSADEIARETDRPFPRRWLLALCLLAGAGALPLLPGASRVQQQAPALTWHTERQGLFELLAVDGAALGSLGFSLAIAAAVLLGAETCRPRFRRLLLAMAAAALPALALRGLSHLLDSPPLAQLRYASPAVGPLALLLLVPVRAQSRGWRGPIGVALGLVAALALLPGVAQRILAPVLHDAEWMHAGQRIAAEAGPHDGALCVTGLVECRLIPVRYADEGFQEYCAARLGQMYLKGPLPRKALPIDAQRAGDAEWGRAYREWARERLALGGAVWLVASADTDPGKRSEEEGLAILRDAGGAPKLVRDNSIARIWRAAKAAP